ncbi:MAG: serine/threonine protein kinase [Polyangiales bacterium]
MGRRLGGRYLLERRIGEGGMAEVLLARDEARSNTPVVVKRCRAHLAHQPEMATLFLREARLASLIHHPNVVELEATGEDDGQPYLVMEYLQGFTVREIFLRSMKEGGVPQDLAAFIILGAARGLHAAHTAVDENGVPMGLMHRDVSPHNLFITDAGVVKVLDFGIAKGVNEATMTRAGHVKGKASYLAPEQLDPEAKIDRRADLFSLGTVAWELLTGRRLFRKPTETDTINAIRALKIERPEKVRPEIDKVYADAVMQLLARHPEQRPADADALVKTLEANLARRAPDVGGAMLARYITHIREIDPGESSRPSFLPPDDRKGGRAAFKKEIEEVFGAGKPKTKPPKPVEEATATVNPPTASWVNMGGGEAPVDGSVVGMFAIAGATSAQGADVSGGFGALDPDDLVPAEPSNVEPLPNGAVIPPLTAPKQPSVPPPRKPMAALSPLHETTRIKPPSTSDMMVARAQRGLRKVVVAVEGRIGRRPQPPVIAAILFSALLAGMTVAFVITTIIR